MSNRPERSQPSSASAVALTTPAPLNAPAVSHREPSTLEVRSESVGARELEGVHWWPLLNAQERAHVQSVMRVVTALPGERVCRLGAAATYWFGVVDGLLKMSNDSASGTPLTFAGLPSGAWFGEGTLLKREAYRYNAEALRTSRVAGVPIEAFHWLLERSLPFNRYVMNQLNERLGQFIAAREIDRSSDPDLRVARGLAALFHPALYPGVGDLLRITQEELGYLVGLSRQRTNEALRDLQTRGLIRIEYGGVRVLSLQGLRSHPA